jgi:hypothetical protein
VRDWFEVLQSGGRAFESGLMLYLLFSSWSYAPERGAQALRAMVRVLEHQVSRSWLVDGGRWHVHDRVALQCVIEVSLRHEFVGEGFGFEARALMIGSARSELCAVSRW